MQNTLNFNHKLQESFNDQLAFNVDRPSSEYCIATSSRSPQGTPNVVRSAQRRYRIRRAIAGIVLSIIGALVWTVLAHVAGLNNDIVGADISPNAPQEIYVVQSGDTLWSIAMTFDTDGDPRDTVDRLAELNGGSNLYIGQRLVLSD